MSAIKTSLRGNEAARLTALSSYQILDTSSEESFDAITRIAAHICGTPISLITFVDEKRQWFKSRVGLKVAQTPREGGFCAHSIQYPDITNIPDARADARFATHPMVVNAPFIRFYAAVPLITAEGYALGTLCVIDHAPRQISEEQVQALRALAHEVMIQLELRRKNLELEPMRGRLELILNAAGEGIYGTDTKGVVTFANPAAARMLGWSINELIGKPIHRLVHHSHEDHTPYPEESRIHATLMDGDVHESNDEVFWKKDGTYFFARYTSTPIMRGSERLGAVVVFEDISEHKKAENLLRESEQHYRVITETATDAIVTIDIESTILFVNMAVEKIFGYTSVELLGRNLSMLMPESMRHSHTTSLKRYLETGKKNIAWNGVELTGLHKSGKTIPLDVSFGESSITDKPIFTGIIRDISARKQADEALARKTQELIRSKEILESQSRILQSILDSMGDGVIVADEEGKLLFINPAAEKIIGLDSATAAPDEMVEQFCTYLPAIITPGSKKDIPLVRAIRGEIFDATDVLMRHAKSSKSVWLSVTGRPLKDSDGASRGGVVVFRDSTEQKQIEQHLNYLANYDALTGLANRILFFDHLTQGLTRTHWQKRFIAVLFLDLDRFKSVNDMFGHNVGDILLQTVAARLVECVRAGDTVARLAGDEFALILADIAHEDDVLRIIKKIQDAMSMIYKIDNHEIFISTSIGISMFPGDGDDADALLRNADTAMYRAKEMGRSHYQHYSSSMGTQAAQRVKLENALHHALEREELQLYYQPLINIATGEITGMEALLRWQHPQAGMLLPSTFISLAEDNGLIVPIGEWVLRTACNQNKAWQRAGLVSIRIAVNLSARQFQQQNILEIIARILVQEDLEARYLEVELTESIMQDMEAIEVLRKLRETGVQIVIDDFGTGYSSLNYLKHFPIDKLKVDQSFVAGIPNDPDNTALTTAIIAMAHSLKLKVVAEGVETIEQLEFLKSLDCHEAQGYYLSKPLPASQITEFLLRNNSRI